MSAILDKVGYFYGFTNDVFCLRPYYNGGVEYDKLFYQLEANSPGVVQGYPLPVVPVYFLLKSIDKKYGTDFSKFGREVVFGENIADPSQERDADHFYDGTSICAKITDISMYNEAQLAVAKIFQTIGTLDKIYDLGVIPCVKQGYKFLPEDDGSFTGGSFVASPIITDNIATRTIQLVGSTCAGLADNNDGKFTVTTAHLALKLRGYVRIQVTSNKEKYRWVETRDLSTVKLVIKAERDGENLGNGNDAISCETLLATNPRVLEDVVAGSGTFDILFEFGDGGIEIATENSEQNRFTEISTANTKTDLNGFWFYPKATNWRKIVSTSMWTGVNNRIYFALEYDKEETGITDSLVKEVNLQVVPDYDINGCFPHEICPVYSLPDIKVLDFLKGLFITEGTYLYKDDDDKIQKRKFTSLLDNIKKENSYNITPIKGSVSVSISSELAQKTIFMSASDKDNQEDNAEYSETGYASNRFVCEINNKYLEEKKVLSTNPFYPAYIFNVDYPRVPTGNCVKNWKIDELYHIEIDGTSKKVGAKLAPEEGKPSIWCIGIESVTNAACLINKKYRFVNSTAPAYRLKLEEIPHFKFKNNPNYIMLRKVLSLGVAIKCKCVINIIDVFNLNWTKPVYIKELNSYFLIVDATWQSSNNVTELNLLKIPADILKEE